MSKEGICLECAYVWTCDKMLFRYNKPDNCEGPFRYNLKDIYHDI